MNNNSFMVFSGTSTRYLAEKICAELNCPLGNLVVTKFADGEFEVCYEESIRGRDVFLVQSTFPSSDNLMELLLMVDAAKRASARSICAVVPYFGWARQDRKSKPRVSTRGRSLERCRYRPLDDDGFTCRPRTRLLRCSGRPSLCVHHYVALRKIAQSAKLVHCNTRRGRF